MKLTVHTTNKGTVTIKEIDADTLLDLTEELRQGDSRFLQFDLEDGKVQTFVSRAQIVRVDVEEGE